MKAFGVLLALILGPAGTIWLGFVVSTLWGWFAVPLGAPIVPIVNAAGLCILLAVFKAKQPKKDEPEWKWLEKWLFGVAMTAYMLGVAWVVKVIAS